MKKFATLFFYVVSGCCALFTVAFLALHLLPSRWRPVDPDNTVTEKRDENGNPVFRRELVGGALHGRYVTRYNGLTLEGEYDRGVKVGRWTERYGNGKIRKDGLYSDCVTEKAEGGAVWRYSVLKKQATFRIDGSRVGSVVDGRGASVFVAEDGMRIDGFGTVGYGTNVQVKFAPGPSGSAPAIRSAYLFAGEADDDDAARRCLFYFSADGEGRIEEVEEGGARAFRKAGSFVYPSPGKIPPFLLGKTRRVIPSLIDGRPVFDTEISCSNGTLVVRKVEPETGR